MGKMIKLVGILDFCKYLGSPDPESGKYSARIILNKKSKMILEKEMELFKKEHVTTKFNKFQFGDAGDRYDDNDRVAGLSYINAKSGAKFAPSLVNRAGKAIDPDNIGAYFYSGVDITAYVTLFKYKYNGNGIGIGLSGIQSHETGEKLFQGGMPEPEFEALEPLDMSDYESADDTGDEYLDY